MLMRLKRRIIDSWKRKVNASSITTIIIRGILKEPEQVSFNPFPGLYPSTQIFCCPQRQTLIPTTQV